MHLYACAPVKAVHTLMLCHTGTCHHPTMVAPALQDVPEHELGQHVTHRTAIIYNDTENAINGGIDSRRVR